MVVPPVILDLEAELFGRDQPWVSIKAKTGFAPLRPSSTTEGDAVRVTAWGVAASGELPPAGVKEPLPPTAAWMQLTTHMVWDGSWKITSVHTEYGPMPPSAQFRASADKVYDQLFDPNSRPAF